MVSIRDQVDAALASARRTGFDGLLDDQREYLDDYWERADVEIDGDDELQQAVRFALFHTLQSAARAEKRAIAAKGLTGDGYDGHVFWDTESFVLPVLTYTAPEAVRDALALAPLDARPRHRARAAAAPRGRRVPVADDPRPRVLGLLAGRHGRLPRQRRHRRRRAALPERDRRRRVRARARARAAGGDRAAVALAGPPRRARRVPHRRGHRARRVLGHRRRQRLHEPHGRAEPGRGGGVVASVTARRPRRSGSATRRSRRGATRPRRSPSPMTTSSRSISSRRATRTTSAGTSRRRRPTSTRCCLHFPYFDLYRKQVVKQADLVLALIAAGDRFTARDKARAFAYYEPLTVRDSSLSACVQAIMAAEVGHLELAFDYFGEAGADGPRRPRAQHARRPAHGLAGRLVAGRGGRVRRLSRPRGPLLLRPAAAAPPRAPGLRAHAARPPPARGDRAGRGALRAGRRRADRAAPR